MRPTPCNALGFLFLAGLIFFNAAQAREINLFPDAVTGTTNSNVSSVSVATALRQARELRRLGQAATNEPLRIVLHGGTYPLTQPLLFRPEDSGTEASPTIIEAAAGERVVLSGGVAVTGWQKLRDKIPDLPTIARRQCWVADSPKEAGRFIEIRQLWVSDTKAIRARQPNDGTLGRLVEWNRANKEARIPASDLKAAHDTCRIEMIFHQQWEIAYCRVKSVELEGDVARLKFREPESKIQFEHPWPQPVMSTNGNAPFYLANAIEFLDQPGEWFQDLSAGKIYYWPRPSEDMAKADVVAPILETLVQVEGSLDRSVHHLQFKGIQFSHTAWMRPSTSGHVPLQGGMFLLDAYKLSPHGTSYHRGLDNHAFIGRAPGAVSIQNADHITFERCRFEHLAFSGLDVQSGTHDDVVEGCTFRDIGGNGIQWGKFSDPGIEAHIPYNPADEREICTRERIANNLVTDCGTEDWGSVGIFVGYGREISIEHNEVCELPYTGISVGWGWNKATNCMRNNLIRANHVHHIATRMGDTAGIYTLSPQPGSLIAENSVHDIHMSPYVFDLEHWFYLYTDEGSSFITVRDNWCPEERFLKNANGPGNVWTNNGPQVSEKIRTAAGLEPAFQNLLRQ